MKIVLQPLRKSVLILFGSTAAASAADARIHKKILGSGTRPWDLAQQTTLIISNEEMGDIMKIVNSLADCALLLKRITDTIQNKAKEQNGGFLSMLLDTLAASLLGNMLAGKGISRARYGIIRAGYGSK